MAPTGGRRSSSSVDGARPESTGVSSILIAAMSQTDLGRFSLTVQGRSLLPAGRKVLGMVLLRVMGA